MLYRATITNREVALDKVGFHQNTVGKDTLRLMLDEEWDGAEFVIVSFYRGRVSRATAEICGQRLWTGEDVDVPAAALTEAGDLRLTVTGVWPDGSQIVTCEMEEGAEVCWSGADSVDYEVDPGKDAISLLADMVQTANAAAVAAKEAAQNAEAIADAGYLPADGAEGQWLRKTAGDSEWADLPVPTAAEVGADPAGSAETAKAEAMEAVGALSARVNLIANSDDETLDQLAEFAAFVKENRNLIENLDPLPQGGADGQVLTLVGGEAAWADSKGGADTWHTATVSLTDDGLAFVGDVPSPHNDGGDALTLAVDVSGAWAEAAGAGALSMRFGDGSEAPVVDGSCYVPREAMAVAGVELSVQAVAWSGQVAAEGEVFLDDTTNGILWTAIPGSAAVCELPALDVEVGETYAFEVGEFEFVGEVMGGDAPYIGNLDAMNGGEPGWNIEFGSAPMFYANFASVPEFGEYVGTWGSVQQPVTFRKVGTPGESASNALTVPLLSGEPGMFTVVERVEGEVLGSGTLAPFTVPSSEPPYVTVSFVIDAMLEDGVEYAVKFGDTERRGVAKATKLDVGLTQPLDVVHFGDIPLDADTSGDLDGEFSVMVSEMRGQVACQIIVVDLSYDGATATLSTAPTATAKRLADAFEEIVERTTVEVAGEVLASGTAAEGSTQVNLDGFTPVDGVEYVINVDGDKYSSVAVTRQMNGMDILYLGTMDADEFFEAAGSGQVPDDALFTMYGANGQMMALIYGDVANSERTVTISTAPTSTPVTEAVTSLSTRVDALEGTGGGGTGPLFVKFESLDGVVTSTKTHSEVLSAIKTVGVIGLLSVVMNQDAGISIDYQACSPTVNLVNGNIDFIVIAYADNNSRFTFQRVSLAEDNTVTITRFNITPDA